MTRATIGEGAITIRDEDAQRAREEAGETRDVAALNRDLDMARETLRDERAGVRFYASDSAIIELGNGFETTRGNLRELSERLSSVIENLSEEHGERLEELAEAMPQEASEEEKAAALADDLVARGEITEDQRDAEAEAILADSYAILSDPEAMEAFAACEPGGRQGFNLHDLLFPRAHANPLALCIAASQWAARALLSWSIAKKAEENISQMAENSGRPGRGHNGGPPLDDGQASGQQQGPDGPQTPWGMAGASGLILGLSGDSPQSTALGVRLNEQLRLEEASSPFTVSGGLKPDMISRSREIIEAKNINNPDIPQGYAKYTTPSIQSPSGDFQVHFYMNPQTGRVFYGRDYKVVFNRRLSP